MGQGVGHVVGGVLGQGQVQDAEGGARERAGLGRASSSSVVQPLPAQGQAVAPPPAAWADGPVGALTRQAAVGRVHAHGGQHVSRHAGCGQVAARVVQQGRDGERVQDRVDGGWVDGHVPGGKRD